MEKSFEERRCKLAQQSKKASKMARKVDLTDKISPMDLNFSLDGFGKLYDDLAKACEASKLAKISGKCVDLAKKLADEVAADWFGMEADAIDVKTEPTICEMTKPEVKKSENKERINCAVFEVTDINSMSANMKNAPDSGCNIYPSSDNEVASQEALEDEVMDSLLWPAYLLPNGQCATKVLATERQQQKEAFDEFCSSNLIVNKIDDTKVLATEYDQQGKVADDEFHSSNLIVNKIDGMHDANLSPYTMSEMLDNEVASQEALEDEVMNNLLWQAYFLPNGQWATKVLATEHGQQEKEAFDEFCSSNLIVNKIDDTKVLATEYEQQEKVVVDEFHSSNLIVNKNDGMHDTDLLPYTMSEMLEIIATEVIPSEALQNNMTSEEPSPEGDLMPNEIYADEFFPSEALQDNMTPDTLSSQGYFTPTEADADEVISPGAPKDDMPPDRSSSRSNLVQNEAHEVSKTHDASSKLGPNEVTDDTTPENIVNFLKPHELEVSKTHDASSKLGANDMTDNTAAENIVNFVKPNELGGFEDVDLTDDWEDDIDYDLNLVSYYESKKKHSKKKLATKFISRLGRSIKSRSGVVAHKPDVNTADSDWELL